MAGSGQAAPSDVLGRRDAGRNGQGAAATHRRAIWLRSGVVVLHRGDVMPDTSGWPPLNTEEGEEWLFSEIEAVRPDLIVFDSVMSLLLGEMGDEKAWAPVNLMMRKISSPTEGGKSGCTTPADDKSRGFGTKTREWRGAGHRGHSDGAGRYGYQHRRRGSGGRHRTEVHRARACGRRATAISSIPNSSSVEPDGWLGHFGEPAARRGAGRPRSPETATMMKARSSATTPYPAVWSRRMRTARRSQSPWPTPCVMRVRNRGHLDTKDTGGLTSEARQTWHRAKTALLQGAFVESGGFIWKLAVT